VRSHVDVLLDAADSLCGVRALLELRAELKDVLDLQVCLLASKLRQHGDDRRALDLGVDVLGGCPHLADDPVAETTRLLDLAERRGVAVDLHTDEQLNPGMLSIRELAAQVRRRGLSQRVTASHCVSLGSLGPAVLAEVLAEVRDAGLAVVTLPITNLYLQGWGHRRRCRGGCRRCASCSRRASPWPPAATTCGTRSTRSAERTVRDHVVAGHAAHLDADQALHAVTGAGREVLGLPAAGPVPGALADLVAVRADA